MEEPLPAGGSCLLGSINLSEYVVNPFTNEAYFDFEDFKIGVGIMVRALNEVLDEGLPLHPLQEQRDSVRDWRQIGAGVMGISDMLIKLGIRYGSEESLNLSGKIAKTMINYAIAESALLAKDMGAYPKYKKDKIFESPFLHYNTTNDTRKLVEQYGLRNSQLLTIAPTGSISTMLGISGGIEPIYNYSYKRRTLSLHDEEVVYTVYTPIVEQYMNAKGIKDESELPSFFTNAMVLNPIERVKMQGIWQEAIDASISSTVNLPNEATVEDVFNLYVNAWVYKLKGLTIFRDGCARLGILTNNETEEQSENGITLEDLPWGTVIACSDDLIGKKRKIVTGCGNIHVQAWFDPIDGRCMEVFLSKGSSGGCSGFMNGLSRMTSLALRTGAPFGVVIDQLKSTIACPAYSVRSATKHDTTKGNSCPTALGNILQDMQQEIYEELRVSEEEIYISNVQVSTDDIVKKDKKRIYKCPECGNELKFETGCVSCTSCHYSRCE